jgi:hypothetical protein
MMTTAMRICVGILGTLHGFAALALLGLDLFEYHKPEPSTTLSVALILLADVMSTIAVIVDAFGDERATLPLSIGSLVNVVAIVAFCVIPFMHEDGEYAEGLGLLIVSGIIIPVLGPPLVNAILLFGIIVSQPPTDSRSKKLPSTQRDEGQS